MARWSWQFPPERRGFLGSRAEEMAAPLALLALLIPLAASLDLDDSPWLQAYELITPLLLHQKLTGNTMELSFLLTLEGKPCVLLLRQNWILISPDFGVFSYSKNKSLLFDEPNIQTNCYYQGFIKDRPSSVVAVSTCSGLRGTMHIDGFRYGIDPVEPFQDFKHVVYRIEDFEPSIVCGLNSYSHLFRRESIPEVQEESRRTKTAYVELFMVSTLLQFTFHDRNATFLIERVLELINYINTVFRSLKTQLVLVGLEIWSEGNPINVDQKDVDHILLDFLAWKNKYLNKRINCDVAVLALRKGVSGLAPLGSACSPNNSAFISVMDVRKLIFSSNLFLHELGHILGMKHDAAGCVCPSGKRTCVMNSQGWKSSGFSNCSVQDMEAFYASKQAQCVWNSDRLRALTQCGNKILEQGEECDCGSIQDCDDLCCDATTCKLLPDGDCSSGLCCKDCKFLPVGTPCRMPSTECDLAEYCDGKSSTCPLDMYLQDGSPCNNDRSVCYEKMCYSYNGHCQRIFGNGAKVAPPSCFKNLNTVGDRFGNCDSRRDAMTECESKDVMCGRIQCIKVTSIHPADKITSVIQTPQGTSWCWGVGIPTRKGYSDIGSVPDGAVCGIGKICLHKRCVNISVLGYDCDTMKKCAGNGVCNNKKNCHCHRKWAPPNCTSPGYGGSVDSGPLTRDSFVQFLSVREMQSDKVSNLANERRVIGCVPVDPAGLITIRDVPDQDIDTVIYNGIPPGGNAQCAGVSYILTVWVKSRHASFLRTILLFNGHVRSASGFIAAYSK